MLKSDQTALSLPVVRALLDSLGPDVVRLGDAIAVRNHSDAAMMMPPQPPLALLLPRSVAEVTTAMTICHGHRQVVVTQGGLTGLAGGAHPSADEIAISLERLTGIEEVDTVSGTLTALAGTPLYQVQEAAAAAGWTCGIDLGARGSCTIGGNVATNAGGTQVLRYGMTRKQVMGLEAVLADGQVVSSMGKMLKNNSGYDWCQLLIGSEGTLGIVTRVVLELQPQLRNVASALLGVRSTPDALKVLRQLQGVLPGGLIAFEGMWREYCQLAQDTLGMASPLPEPHDILLLVEAPLGDADPSSFEAALGDLFEAGLVQDAVIAKSEAERARFWALRESIYEFKSKLPPGISFDISVPLDRMAQAIDALRLRCPELADGVKWGAFGHLADSNIHVRVSAPGMESVLKKAVQDAVYQLVSGLGGSISAEHGIGRLKRPYLPLTRSAAEIALMATIKSALDPLNILNRGRIFQ